MPKDFFLYALFGGHFIYTINYIETLSTCSKLISAHWTIIVDYSPIWPRFRRLSIQVGEESEKFLGIE